MSDADRLEQQVAISLFQFLPEMQADNRTTLIYLIVGLILGRNVQLAKIAEQVNYLYKESSLEERFRRFVRNDKIEVTMVFSIFIKLILAGLDEQKQIVLSIDTSKSGGNCITLMLSIAYKTRSMPLCWLTFKGRKGHSSEQLQLLLLKTAKSLIPVECQVILLGDGEFDGSEVVTWLEAQAHWHYVCRTAKDIHIEYEEEWIALQDIGLGHKKEAFFSQVRFTKTNQVGPLNIMAVWVSKAQEFWFFVTDFADVAEARFWYRQRFKIETLFSDIKGRGFNVQKCRLKDPQRVDRLLMAVAIAYIFVVFWGVEAIVSGDFKLMVRTDRFDHSLFTLGFKYIHRLLKKCLAIPPLSDFPPPSSFVHVVL